jgi:hypothetical protein
MTRNGAYVLSRVQDHVQFRCLGFREDRRDTFALAKSHRHRAVSGGSDIYAGKAGAITGQFSVLAEGHEAWIVIAANGGEEKGEVQASAYCAGTGKAVTARSSHRSSHTIKRVREEERRLFVTLARRWKG